MRVMVLVKASKESEAGQLPSEKLLAGEGLHPSSTGQRVRLSGRNRIVTDGPFAETKELVAGYWVWDLKSIDEAVEWLKRVPFEEGDEIEIRPVLEAD